MKVRFSILIYLVALAACGVQDAESADATYVSGDGSSLVKFSSGKMYLGATDPANADVSNTEITKDCSDANFRCLAAGMFVFSVPRGVIKSGSVYAKDGMRFSVKNCIDDRKKCNVVLIAANCEIYENRRCRINPNGIGRTDIAGLSTYYIYDDSRGVISMGFSPDHEALNEAHAFILTGKFGILH